MTPPQHRYSVQDKVAIITGGSSGFGKALAIRLVDNGAKVVLGDVDDAQGQALARELNKNQSGTVAVYRHCNVCSKEDQESLFRAAIDAFGSVDIKVCNAGIAERDAFIGNETDTWTKVIDIDLTAVILGSRLAISHFLKHKKEGVVVNVASLAGLYPQGPQPVYAAAKAGVVNLTKSLGWLQAKDGIRVNAVCPSFVKTALTSDSLQEGFAIKEWVEIDLVIDAFMMAIQDRSLAGDVIRITPQYGIDVPTQKKRGKL
ncbi:hypothetical protein HDV03_004441 [Kappamyces sp. JEL0829]|nr:hypothetical protein HDV03_004441 [Kappamyces sp. JEL0829]